MDKLFPQRRMVTHYREQVARYLRIAEATSNASVQEFALSRACDYEADANVEERAILRLI